MPLPHFPLLSTLTALALVACAPARAEWLDGAWPSVATPTLATDLATAHRYSYLHSTLVDGEAGSDEADAVWVIAQLSRQTRAEAPPPLIDADQAMPPLSAARSEDGNMAGRRIQASARLQSAPATLAAPAQQQARPEFSMALPDPVWIAVPGAMLALVGWRTQRRKQRDRRPAMLYVAR